MSATLSDWGVIQAGYRRCYGYREVQGPHVRLNPMPGPNLLVFRDTRRTISAHVLVNSLRKAIQRVTEGDHSNALDALITAGQLECALSDSQSAEAPIAEAITDFLAGLCLNPNRVSTAFLQSSLDELARVLDVTLTVSDPEGFSYYALHPLDFADSLAQTTPCERLAVIGIRSIGTTLSAVAVAALKVQGSYVSRITVRPVGHPYDRHTNFSQAQSTWVEKETELGASFLVVDEGPGLSGSSFLSVAEGLVRHRVAKNRITLLGTRQVEPSLLCTTNARYRWGQFSSQAVSSRISARFSGLSSIGGGTWRQLWVRSESAWPACWTDMESPKFLSPDLKSVFKFEGFGHFGTEARSRSDELCDAGFAPAHEDFGEGVSRYEIVTGEPLAGSDLTTEVLNEIARYCSFRAKAFPASASGEKPLEKMLFFNYSQETGCELALDDLSLDSDQPVVSDSRMQPHEWIRTDSGRIAKIDGARHGDDLFLPGPADISWDLAGAIVEWNMDEHAVDYLAQRFRKHSGRKVSRRLPWFVVAYAAFRMGYCKMAMHSVQDEQEKSRNERAYRVYRSKMEDAASRLTCGTKISTPFSTYFDI